MGPPLVCCFLYHMIFGIAMVRKGGEGRRKEDRGGGGKGRRGKRKEDRDRGGGGGGGKGGKEDREKGGGREGKEREKVQKDGEFRKGGKEIIGEIEVFEEFAEFKTRMLNGRNLVIGKVKLLQIAEWIHPEPFQLAILNSYFLDFPYIHFPFTKYIFNWG